MPEVPEESKRSRSAKARPPASGASGGGSGGQRGRAGAKTEKPGTGGRRKAATTGASATSGSAGSAKTGGAARTATGANATGSAKTGGAAKSAKSAKAGDATAPKKAASGKKSASGSKVVPIDAAPSSKGRGGAAKEKAESGGAKGGGSAAGSGRGGGSGSGPRSGGTSGSSGGRARPALTSRAAILALVICMIALSLAYPLREYLAQRARIAELREEKAQTEQAVDELRERRQHLKDPAYIEREARTRLHYQYPDERAYVVVSDEDQQDAGADAGSGEPWFTRLWQSVLEADSPKQEPKIPEAEPTG